MRKKDLKHNSWINRKRPAVEGMVEDLLGPASQLDELISGNPLPEENPNKDNNVKKPFSESQTEPG